ncbi:MAG: hypothetical protein P1V20_09390 [Verrucomicrobiales bacterium]|nr:hypothetical protein [Verrucomicrobiales bacterium]
MDKQLINESIIAIDFGNSFCKVSIRLNGVNVASTLLRDDSYSYDEGNFCIPSVFGYLRNSNRFLFGTDALRDNSADLEIIRNWKPNFFDESDQNRRDSLSQLFGHREGIDVETAAIGYFNWLRKEVSAICRNSFSIDDISSIPARITLPAFGNVANATYRLRELLEESEWNVDATFSAIHEPYANSIGVFSEGRSAIWKPDIVAGERVICEGKENEPHFGKMFGGSTFFEEFRNYALEKSDQKIHWVFVADLGGYTLDFAMFGFNLNNIQQTFSSEVKYDGLPAFARRSYPLGVMDIDELVYEKGDAISKKLMDKMFSDKDQLMLNTFHQTAYSRSQPFFLGAASIQPEIVNPALEDFLSQAAKSLDNFMAIHQYRKVDQMVLTGGGSNIPAFRQLLIDRLKPGYTHGAVGNEVIPQYSELPHDFVRGATALGGSSVYFEF